MAVDTQGKSAWTGKDVSEREINLLNQRVIQFTDIEDTFLDVWLQLENANLDELAAKVINAGLLFRSEEHTSELQSQSNLVCRLLLEKKKKTHLTPVQSYTTLTATYHLPVLSHSVPSQHAVHDTLPHIAHPPIDHPPLVYTRPAGVRS